MGLEPIMQEAEVALDSFESNQKEADRLLRQGDVEGALSYLHKMLELRPDDPRCHNQVGVILFERGEREKAEHHFLQALQADFGLIEAHFNVACLYQKKEDYQRALSHFKEVVTGRPDDADAYTHMGECSLQAGMMAEAEAFLTEALRLQPDRLEAAVLLGGLYVEAGRLLDAEEVFERALQRHRDLPQLHFTLGRVLEEQGKFREAMGHFREVVLKDGTHADAFYRLGVCCKAVGIQKEAETFLAQAIKLRPDFAEAIYDLGVLYYEQENIEDAALFFREYARLRPKDEEAQGLVRACTTERAVNVLIVMEEGIGNMVMLTPAIRAIKTVLPNARITVLGREPSLGVIRGWELVDRAVDQLDGERYDYGFFTIWSNGTRQRLGPEIRKRCKQVVELPYDDVNVHEVEHHMKIARQLGYSGPTPSSFCMHEDVDIALPAGKPVVGLADAALDLPDWERKRWPYYPDLARRLMEKGYTVVLIGGPAEAKRFTPEAWPEGVVNGLGKYSIPQTAGLMKRCDLVIANDSGPAHMAAALGVKTFVIFGATRTTKNRPYGEDVTIISIHLPCSPCQYTPRWSSCMDWRCMRDLSVDDVLSAVFKDDDALKLVAKDYSSCEAVREELFPYIQKGTVKERIKIHLVGARWSNFPWGMENEVFRSFEKMGYEVFDTDYRRQRDQFAELFLRDAHLMLVFKGSGIPPELIRQVRCPAVLWYQDDVFTTGHGRRDIAYNASAFDVVYSFDREALEEYRKHSVRDARWLPLAMSPAVHRKMYLPKKYDVSFVGTLFPNRKQLIERLRKRFDVFVARAYMDEMVKIFNESKIVLNVGVGPTGIQSRVFEALGCGSFLLTNEIPESSRLFEDRKHLVYFNEENIEDLIAYYLEHEDEREEIALNGYLEAHAKHTYDHRAEHLIADFFPVEQAESEKRRGSSAGVITTRAAKRRLLVFWHGIGDNIMATPALRALRKKYPYDHIGYMYLRRIHKDRLMEGTPYLDALYTCSDAWDDYANYETGVRAVIEEAKAVARQEGYDEVIPITMRACSLERHRIDRIAYELGVELDSWETELAIPNAERQHAEAILREWGITKDDFVVAIHRRGANVHKFWDVEEAQRFVDYMRKNYNAKFVAFETHTDLDRETGPQFQGEGIFSTATLPEDVSLKLSAALIEQCDLFVGIDSGPMWLATTTKTPIIALFTMTWMHQSAPLRENSLIVASEKAWEMATKEFKGRYGGRILRDPTGGTCIRAESVMEAVRRLLPEGRKTPTVVTKRDYLYRPPPAFHQPGAYWGAFLTLTCSADCPYCIQKIVPEEFKKARRATSLSGEEWVRLLNGIEHRSGQPLALTGGEPSIHPDFLYVLNNLEGYTITVTTNLISKHFDDVDELIRDVHPTSPVRFNTSFHPGSIEPEEYIRRVKRMKALGLWVDQVAMVNHPGSEFEEYRQIFRRHGLELRPQSFLGYWNGKLYPTPDDPNVTNDPREHGITDLKLYREGFSARKRQPIYCQTRRFLIGPDGWVYNCHYHLYSHKSPVGDLTKGEVHLKEGPYYCEDFGFCNPCDFPHVTFKPVEQATSSTVQGEGPDEAMVDEEASRVYDANYFWKTEERTRYVFEPMAQYLKEVFGPKKVLDVGCGMGFLVKWLRTFGVDAYGCDHSAYAIGHVSDVPYLTPNRIDVRKYVQRETIEGLLYPDNSFDLVTCLDVFEHLKPEQAKRAIRELERVTSRYLFMIITVHDEPDKELILPQGAKDDPTHVTVASAEFWHKLFEEETDMVHRSDLERLSSINVGQILPWTFFIYEKARCPLCGGRLHRPVVKDLMRCEGCGVYRKKQIPLREVIREQLRGMMLRACYDKSKEASRLRDAEYQLDLLEKYVQPGVLYDVGAAGGFFMKAAKERGWHVMGNEISQKAIEWAQQRYGVEIEYGFLEELNPPKGRFDAVVLWHTLEHTVDPRATLNICRDMLHDGGLLMIGVPEKREEDLARRYEAFHFYEFNRDSLHQLLEGVGFHQLEVIVQDRPDSPQIHLLYRKGSRVAIEEPLSVPDPAASMQGPPKEHISKR